MECPFFAEDLRGYVDGAVRARIAELEGRIAEQDAELEAKAAIVFNQDIRIAELEAQAAQMFVFVDMHNEGLGRAAELEAQLESCKKLAAERLYWPV